MGLELELETDENVIFYTVNAGLTGTYIHICMFIPTYIISQNNYGHFVSASCYHSVFKSQFKFNLTGN